MSVLGGVLGDDRSGLCGDGAREQARAGEDESPGAGLD